MSEAIGNADNLADDPKVRDRFDEVSLICDKFGERFRDHFVKLGKELGMSLPLSIAAARSELSRLELLILAYRELQDEEEDQDGDE